MKILLIHNLYLQPGGEDEVVKTEKKMLEQFGHKVILYERYNKEIEAYNVFQKIKFTLTDIYWSKVSYKAIRKIIQKEKPDIAHIHNTFSVISPSVYQACHDENIPIVQTLHNYRFLCPIAIFYRSGKVCTDCLSTGRKAAVINRCWKNSYFMSFVLKRIIDKFYAKEIVTKTIDHFIVLSEFSKKMHVQNGFAQDKLTVKPNFLDFDPGISSVNGDYALFVGGLQDYKGIKVLLEAWGKLKGLLKLKIIGDGPLRQDVIAASKETNIEFLGQRPLSEVMEHMKKSFFVVLPSQCFENFPRVIVEAYACGKPVVVSDIGSLGELVQKKVTGLRFDPKSSDDLAQKVQWMIANPSLAQEMGQNARKVYEEKYIMQENYSALLKIYEKTIVSSRKVQIPSQK